MELALKPNTSTKKTSVSLVNTEQRLNLLFSVELLIDSSVNQGTTVSHLPFQKVDFGN